jgi:hypothetical protein
MDGLVVARRLTGRSIGNGDPARPCSSCGSRRRPSLRGRGACRHISIKRKGERRRTGIGAIPRPRPLHSPSRPGREEEASIGSAQARRPCLSDGRSREGLGATGTAATRSNRRDDACGFRMAVPFPASHRPLNPWIGSLVGCLPSQPVAGGHPIGSAARSGREDERARTGTTTAR